MMRALKTFFTSRRTWLAAIIIVATVGVTILFSRFCWFKRNEHVALWLEGMALIFIFGLDYFNRLDEAQEHKSEHEETLEQLRLLRQQAQAAIETAAAAKKSADLTAALHRPYMGVSTVVLGGAERYWNMTFVLRNFGTLSAFNTGFTVEYFVESALRGQHSEPTAVQVFPSSTFNVDHQFDSGIIDAGPLRSGERKLAMKVYIPYQTEDGRQFEYTAEMAHNHGRIEIDKSNTIEKNIK
jgi:hypothetical protein